MGIRRIKACDVTGQELSDDTQAELLVWQGHRYNLYLSDDGREQLTSFLEPILEGADEDKGTTSTTARRTGRSKTSRSDLEEIRAWARDQGMSVADRGRIKGDIVSAYDAAKGS